MTRLHARSMDLFPRTGSWESPAGEVKTYSLNLRALGRKLLETQQAGVQLPATAGI